MKKNIIIAALLLATILLVSCIAEIPATQITEPQQPYIGDKVSATQITEHQPYIAKVDDSDIFVGNISDLSFVNDEVNLPTLFPIYLDRFPIGQLGPLFNIDQSIVDLMIENLSRFLEILGVPNFTIEQYEPEISHKVFYSAEETSISAGISDISITTSGYGIIDDVVSGNLLDNTKIQAALEYMNIENPHMVSVMQYGEGGDIYTYLFTITETSDDFFENIQNSNFSYVNVMYYADSTRVSLKIIKIDTSELHSYMPVLPYEEALEYIQHAYGVDEGSNICAEIYYSSMIEQGYYIPCYKFYIEENTKVNTPVAAAGGSIYEVVHIPMAYLEAAEQTTQQELLEMEDAQVELLDGEVDEQELIVE